MQYDPSAGLLLKFVGDMIYLVLLQGSNLNALVNGSMNLYDRGIQRHRVTWVRELTRRELEKAEEGEVTIDASACSRTGRMKSRRAWHGLSRSGARSAPPAEKWPLRCWLSLAGVTAGGHYLCDTIERVLRKAGIHFLKREMY